MERETRTSRTRHALPAALTALAVTMPLTLAVTVSAGATGLASPARESSLLSQQRDDAFAPLVRCVSEAARQWAGSQPSIVSHVSYPADVTPLRVAVAAPVPQGFAIPQLHALPHLLNLPPPVC
ncbi:MAG: hypothetical protein GC159_18345 [Phycisphaera sp.]|nr:hypothetical protein [Phycisphaera sp.]